MRYSCLIFLWVICTASIAQNYNKKYRWKHLGPITTPYSLVDSGRWSAVGMGWVEDLLIDHNDWYAGAMTGGLYKSTNKGKTWKKIDKDSIQMGTLCLLKVDKTLYRGTGVTHYDKPFGFGIYQSMDKGKTWQKSGLHFQKNERIVIWDMDVSVSKKLAACSPDNVYVQKPDLTWQKVFYDKKANFRSILCDKSSTQKLWVAGEKLMYSSDFGNSWEDKTKQLTLPKTKSTKIARIALCQDPNNYARLLAFYGHGYDSYIDESLDGGQTWHSLFRGSNVRRADVHHTEIAISPDNSDVIVVGCLRAYVSTNGGKSFEEVTKPIPSSPQFCHDDIRGISLMPNSQFYLASDGGVFKSTNLGQSWQNKSGKGLAIAQIYGMDILQDGKILIGSQDLGYSYLEHGKWKHLGAYYGDGGDAIQTSRGTLLLLGGRLKLIDINKPKGYNTVHPHRGGNSFIAKVVRYPDTKDSFYYTGFDVWFNNGQKWKNLTKTIDGNSQVVLGFDINATNKKQLFFSYDQPTWNSKKMKGKLFKSADGGSSWQDITERIPVLAWHHCTSITSNAHNPDEVYISLGKMDTDQLHKVYKSTDGGLTWTNYSSGLPPYETFIIKHIEGTTGVLLSSVAGIFYRNAHMESWVRLKGKIPPMAARDLQIDVANKKIYVATYGNGLWQMRMPRRLLKN